jgi:hypothetical protein
MELVLDGDWDRCLVFGIWLAMFPADLSDKTGFAGAFSNHLLVLVGLWLLIRIVGYVVTVPWRKNWHFVVSLSAV